MTEQQEGQVQLLMIRGIVASMTPEDQEAIRKHAEHLRTYLKEGGAMAQVALALVGAEACAEI